MKKKYMIAALVIMIILVVSIYLVLNNRNKKNNQLSYNAERTSFEKEIIQDETKPIQGNLIFSEISLNTVAASNIISGKVRNNGQSDISCGLYMQMYQSKTGKILGVSETSVNDLKSGEETNFEIILIGDYKTANRFAIEAMDVTVP